MRIGWTSLFVAVAAVASITIATPSRAGLFSSGWEDASEEVDACFAKVKDDADVQLLERKISLSESPSIAQLSDETIPTEGDVAAMQRGLDKRAPRRNSANSATV